MRRTMKWIRRRLRAWLGVDAELLELRQQLAQLERRIPVPERRTKEWSLDGD